MVGASSFFEGVCSCQQMGIIRENKVGRMWVERNCVDGMRVQASLSTGGSERNAEPSSKNVPG